MPQVRTRRRPSRRCGRRRTDDRVLPRRRRARTARACRSSASPRDVGTPAYVYSAATIRDRYARLDAHARAGAASHSLHAQGELEPRRARAAPRARRRRRRRVRRRAVSRAARRLRAGGHHLRRRRQDGARAARGARRRRAAASTRSRGRGPARSTGSPASVGVAARVGIARESRSHGRHAAPTTSRRARRGTSSAFRTTTSCTSRDVAAELPNVELVGLDMHIGSQLSRIDPYRDGTERLRRSSPS